MLAVALGSCSRRQSSDVRDRVKSAYDQAKTAVTDTWQDVKSYTYDKRSKFSDDAHGLASKMDDQIDELRHRWDDAKASERKKAALDELKRCQTDFKARVDDLGHASAQTWESAKGAVVDSWNHLKTAYQKARED
jgi:gas vesicle protein